MSVVESLTRPLAALLDRAAGRTVTRNDGATGPQPAPPSPLYSSFHDLLHAQRSVELSRMPKPARVLLSAGCSGTWYFDWITRWYGPVERHVGIEQYLPKPDVLPDNVDWIAASVAAMPQVADASVDLVFSGQNIEHLFGDDVAGFLLESARVLRAGGHLVIDSPHREIARLLTWSMAEHTIEFTPDEATELVELAGFDVTSLRGVWLCRDPDSGIVWPLDPFAAGVSADDIVRRVQLAARYPHDAFIWWLEARRSERAPDAEALRHRHAELFTAAWTERCRRFLSNVGERREDGARRIVAAPAGAEGYLLFGPYMPLAAGRYHVTFPLRRGGGRVAPDTIVAVVDAIADADGGTRLARREVRASELPGGQWTPIDLGFDVAALRWVGQLRVYGTGVDGLDADTAVALDDRGTAVWPPLARRA